MIHLRVRSRRFFKSALLCVSLSIAATSCSSSPFDSATPNQKPSSPKTTPSPKKPTPTPTPPPIEQWVCKISNNEGRIFTRKAESRSTAEAQARQECQISYRHCSILDCAATEPEPE